MIGRLRFMREHAWTRRHVHDYLDGDLPPAAGERLERHAGLCPECRRALRGLRRTLDGLVALRSPAPRGLAGGVVERVRREG